jgi:hypothetical protein
MVGENVCGYEGGQVAVYSVDVPIAAQITRASSAEPYLNLKFDLDAQRVAELALKVYPHGLPEFHENRALYVGQEGAPILDAAMRLLDLMTESADAELLAPLVVDEILIRLLRSPMGARVARDGPCRVAIQQGVR